jgi:hypothetical protein
MTVAQKPYLNVCCKFLIVKDQKWGIPLAQNHMFLGKRLGRPKRVAHAARIAELRAQGAGWKKISRQMGIGVGTLYRLAAGGSKIREKVF